MEHQQNVSSLLEFSTRVIMGTSSQLIWVDLQHRKAINLGYGNPDLKPSLPCGHIQANIEKAMAVNPDRKPGMEPRKRLSVNTDNFSVAPAAKLILNIMPSIPLDLVGKTEWRAMESQQRTASIHNCPGLVTPVAPPND